MGGGLSPWLMVAFAVISGLAGMFSHWIKLVFKDKLDLGVLQYFFVNNLRSTIYACVGTLGALFAAFSSVDYTTTTAYQVIIQAFAIGYASDSILNVVPDEARK